MLKQCLWTRVTVAHPGRFFHRRAAHFPLRLPLRALAAIPRIARHIDRRPGRHTNAPQHRGTANALACAAGLDCWGGAYTYGTSPPRHISVAALWNSSMASAGVGTGSTCADIDAARSPLFAAPRYDNHDGTTLDKAAFTKKVGLRGMVAGWAT